MTTETSAHTAHTVCIIPAFRYRDAPAAIDWLCRAFGFTRHLVVPGPDGTIAHAQLVLGGAMVMLGSGGRAEYDRLVVHPSEAGGVTQAAYVVVPTPTPTTPGPRTRARRS